MCTSAEIIAVKNVGVFTKQTLPSSTNAWGSFSESAFFPRLSSYILTVISSSVECNDPIKFRCDV